MFKKTQFSEIPLTRALSYLLALGILPLIFIYFNYQTKKNELSRLQSLLSQIQYKSAIQREKLSVNDRVQNHFSHSDSAYINTHIHTLSFLSQEKEALEKIMSSHNFSGDKEIEDRYHFLCGEENRLSLIETQVQSQENMYETHLSLAHPIEIDTQDLKEILTTIENPSVDAPQLIITDLEIERKNSIGESEVYSLQKLKLLKREFENNDK